MKKIYCEKYKNCSHQAYTWEYIRNEQKWSYKNIIGNENIKENEIIYQAPLF